MDRATASTSALHIVLRKGGPNKLPRSLWFLRLRSQGLHDAEEPTRRELYSATSFGIRRPEYEAACLAQELLPDPTDIQPGDDTIELDEDTLAYCIRESSTRLVGVLLAHLHLERVDGFVRSQDVARWLGIDRRQVVRARAALRSAGWLAADANPREAIEWRGVLSPVQHGAQPHTGGRDKTRADSVASSLSDAARREAADRNAVRKRIRIESEDRSESKFKEHSAPLLPGLSSVPSTPRTLPRGGGTKLATRRKPEQPRVFTRAGHPIGHIDPEDLSSQLWLDLAYASEVEAGRIRPGEAQRDELAATVELALGGRDPVALFVSLRAMPPSERSITGEHEDRARRRKHAHRAREEAHAMQTTEAESPTLVSPNEPREPKARTRRRRRVERPPSASGSLFDPPMQAESYEPIADELESGEVASAAQPPEPAEPAKTARLRDAPDWEGTADDDARMQALVDRWDTKHRREKE